MRKARSKRTSTSLGNSTKGKRPLVDEPTLKERITRRINTIWVEHRSWILNKHFLKPKNLPSEILAEIRKIAREDSGHVGKRLDERQLEVFLRRYAEGQIRKGKAEDLFKKEIILPPLRKWISKDVRTAAVRILVSELGKKPTELTALHFFRNGLGHLLKNHLGSPYEAVKETFPELNLQPWEMKNTPKNFWKSKKNRVKATRWLAKKIEKKPTELTWGDYNKNGLRGLLAYVTPCEAAKEASSPIEHQTSADEEFEPAGVETELKQLIHESKASLKELSQLVPPEKLDALERLIKRLKGG